MEAVRTASVSRDALFTCHVVFISVATCHIKDFYRLPMDSHSSDTDTLLHRVPDK